MRGRNNVAGNGARTAQLEEEAAMMERKLGALKEAMAKERDKRESIKAKAPAGGFWRTSSKGTTDVRKGKPVRTAKDRVTPPSREAPTTTGRDSGSKPGSARQPPTGRPGKAPAEAPPRLEAQVAGRRQPLHTPPTAAPAAETGMSCGTEDMEPAGGSGSQFDGQFNEAANRRDFLDALAAWRGGGNASTAAGPAATAGATERSPPAACTETQTGTEPPGSTAKPTRPYFDKLMMEAAARAAGEQAAASMGARKRGSSARAGVAAGPSEGEQAPPA
eukprot:jgi/Tetstr1/423218/TSEL_001336.t1